VVAYLMLVNFPEWIAPISRDELVIGRGEEATIRLPDRFRSISRKHSRVWANEQDRMWISDLGSRLGTYLNGVPLNPEQQVEIVIGDRIQLGGLQLELLDQSRITAEIAEMNVPEAGKNRQTRSAISSSARCSSEFVQDLTPAELEIVLWMCRGFTGLKAISRKLHRSPHTVRTQLGSIFLKTGVHCRDELVGRLRRAAAGEGS